MQKFKDQLLKDIEENNETIVYLENQKNRFIGLIELEEGRRASNLTALNHIERIELQNETIS